MSSSLVLELREFLALGRSRLKKRAARSTASPVRASRNWLVDHTRLMDEVLRRIYLAAWQEVYATHGIAPAATPDGLHAEHENKLALLAIGGYGRAELCPHSDIDIAFVPDEEEHPLLEAAVKAAFRLIVEVLMDGARLDVAYAYRPLADCARLDAAGKTALLDARTIAGGENLLPRLHRELFRSWDGVEFLLEQARERRAIAARAELSQYAIEPHLKEGAGGLRDLQSALWVSGVMLQTSQALAALEWRGVVTAHDCEQVAMARDFFLALRIWLHSATDRKTDVLRVEQQDKAARAWGHGGSGAQPAQRLLADYYQHAENVASFSRKVLAHLLEGPLRLDDHFVAVQQRVQAEHPHALDNHPELILAPFAQAHKYGFALAPQLERIIEKALPQMSAITCTHKIARAGFWELLRDPASAAAALTTLHEHGVLQRFIPEIQTLLHLAPADPSHQLTVGAHSIQALRELGKMWKKRRDDDALASVWNGVSDVELLNLATLLHDVGKIEAGTDHSISGARLASEIGKRLGLNAERNAILILLVRHHLLLPRTARLRDLAAPGTIRDVIKKVRNVTVLKMLYLLSLADTCAVGERTYSQLDLDSMRELYERTLIAMTRAETAEVLSDSEKREQMAQRERARLRRELRHLKFDGATLQQLSEHLPASYVLNTPLPTVAAHLKFLDQLPQENLITDFYHDPSNAFTEMTLVTYDEPEPGLLSKLCGVVHAAGAEILAAHVYTIRNPQPENGQSDIVLDRLQLAVKNRALSESRCARLAALLRQVFVGEQSVEEVLRVAGKKTSGTLSPQRIEAQNDLSDEHTVLSVVNDNVPGLLYDITRAVAKIGLDIHTAKVTTWGGRAEDAFYVTRRSEDGTDQKLADDALKPTLEALRRQLAKPD